MALLAIRKGSLTLGSKCILDDADFFVESGERICIVGRNGIGKSSLLLVLAGRLALDAGERFVQPGLRLGYLSQSVPELWRGSVFAVTADALGQEGHLLAAAHLAASGQEDLLDAQQAMAADAAAQHGEAWDRYGDVLAVINSLGLDPDADFSTLSGGTKRRVALARALVSSDLLLLDEPTNHLDISTICWLEEFLARQSRTLVFVSHDRAFARRLSSRVVELDRTRLYSYACPYDSFLERREDRLHAEEVQNAAFDKKLAQEEAWIRQGIKARRTRNMGRVRELLRMRRERAARLERMGNAVLYAQEAEKSGKLVAEMRGASFCWPDGHKVFKDASLIIQRGDKIGVIGDNGVGKTTFLRVLLGNLAPTGGSVRLGTNVQVAYFDQLRATLSDGKTLMESVTDGSDHVTVNGQDRHVAGYLQDFLFPSGRLRTLVGSLSGGERNRLLLARLFACPSNVLVLDEPTNDLDVETLELLEDMLSSYSGTVLLVSHDRDFLNNLVTAIIALEGDGMVRCYAGGYDDWLRQSVTRNATAEPAAKSPWKGNAHKKRRMTFKEKRELEDLIAEREALPARLDALECEQHNLEALLADPGLYARDHAEFARITVRLPQVEEEQLELLERGDALDARIAQLEALK